MNEEEKQKLFDILDETMCQCYFASEINTDDLITFIDTFNKLHFNKEKVIREMRSMVESIKVNYDNPEFFNILIFYINQWIAHLQVEPQFDDNDDGMD